MKTEDIKTWRDRITTPTTNQKNLFMSMQAEIDELRAALKERDAEIAELGADVRTWVNSWTALKEQTTSCIDELRAALADRDAKLAALEG